MSDFGWAEGIAIMAGGIGFLSFVAAFWSANAAEKSADAATKSASEAALANRINLHTHRKELYSDFQNLFMHMQQRGRGAKKENVGLFHSSSNTAKLYVRGLLADQIEKYYYACFWVVERQESIEALQDAIKNFPLRSAPGTPVPREMIDELGQLRQEQTDYMKVVIELGHSINEQLVDEIKLV